MFSCKFAEYFQNTFSKNTSGERLLKYFRTRLGVTTQRPITTVHPTENSTKKPTVTLEPHNGGKKSRLLFVENIIVPFIFCYNYCTAAAVRVEKLMLS